LYLLPDFQAVFKAARAHNLAESGCLLSKGRKKTVMKFQTSAEYESFAKVVDCLFIC
jgi:hypothetical protein